MRKFGSFQAVALIFKGALIAGIVLSSVPSRAAQSSPGYGNVPIAFEPNRGQTDEAVKFLSRGRGYSLFLTESEAVFSLGGKHGLRVRLEGVAPTPKITGRDRLPGVSNYFFGRDRSRWRAGVPHYAKVGYDDVYPGIDLMFYGTGEHRLEYDFVVAPDADPSQIALGFEGADRLEVDEAGDLVVHLSGGEVRFLRPVIYQETDGARQPVAGGYALKDNRVGFDIAAYDTAKPLVIDPELAYATYLGGSDIEEYVRSIAVDGSGTALITGRTRSTDFPIAGAVQESCIESDGNFGCHTAFVTKLNAAGSNLVYSTYLGGASMERGWGIAVDGDGNAYVVGEIDASTMTDDFPTTIGAFQESAVSASDAFFVKLNASGSLAYSTYLGGSSKDVAWDVAIDPAGRAVIAGESGSEDFPTTLGAFDPYCGEEMNHYDCIYYSAHDAFLAVLDPAGGLNIDDPSDDLVYATYLGGNGDDPNSGDGHDAAFGVAVDAAGLAYVTGETRSENFPTTPGAIQDFLSAFDDGFLAVINPAVAGAGGLAYATYLGGDGSTFARDVALRPGCVSPCPAYLVGTTAADNLPTTLDAIASYPVEEYSGFLTVIKPDEMALVPADNLLYSTYLGGTGWNFSVDSAGRVYIAGGGSNLPTRNAIYDVAAGGSDALITVVDPSVSGVEGLRFATFLGGAGQDSGAAAVVGPHGEDAEGAVYVSGQTASQDFPTTVGAFQPELGMVDTDPRKKKGPPIPSPISTDAFIAKFSGPFEGEDSAITLTPKKVAADDSYSVEEENILIVPAPGILANDTDIDDGKPDTALVVSYHSDPAHGALTISENGGFTYTPEADFFGTDRFSYSASDGEVGDVTLVRIEVLPVNDPPVASSDIYTGAAADFAFVVSDPGVLRNDRDPDRDHLNALLANPPTNGVVNLSPDGGFTYTANAGFSGPDSFTYKANDGEFDSNLATVTIDVSGGALHVGDVETSDRFDAGFRGTKSTWGATVWVVVHDQRELEGSVVGATVSGEWLGASGGEAQISDCVTELVELHNMETGKKVTGGMCRVYIEGLDTKIKSITYQINDLTLVSLTYDPSMNHDPEGDIPLAGTNITVPKPTN